eukprot:g1127.t1
MSDPWSANRKALRTMSDSHMMPDFALRHREQRQNLKRHTLLQAQSELRERRPHWANLTKLSAAHMVDNDDSASDSGSETGSDRIDSIGPNIETAYGGYRQKLAQDARNIANSPAKVRRFSDDGQGTNAKDPVLGNILERSHTDRALGVRVVVLLAALGIVAAILNESIELFVSHMYEWKISLFTAVLGDTTDDMAQGSFHWFIFFAWTLTLVFISCMWVVYWGPQAAGSGIPEMKTMMAGDGMGDHEQGWAKGYLDLRTGVAKVGGLAFALASGSFIGREGPFVHLSCIVAKQLMRHGFFSPVNKSRTLRPQILGAACAVGVSSSFFAPIGGVLFSIEVTATYYLVSSYWKSFLSAMFGAIAVRTVAMAIHEYEKHGGVSLSSSLANPFFRPKAEQDHSLPLHTLNEEHYQLPSLMGALLVGLLCGLWTCVFVRGAEYVMRFKKTHFGPGPRALKAMRRPKAARQWKTNVAEFSFYRRHIAPHVGFIVPKRLMAGGNRQWFDLGYIILVCLLTSLIRFPGNGHHVEMSPKKIMQDLFAANRPLPNSWGAWGGLGEDNISSEASAAEIFAHECPVLLYFAFCYILLACFSILLPVPAGVFIPSFALGGVLGRFVGLVLMQIDRNWFDPGAFAVIGAGAMAGGVTRTISASVLTLEMTGHFHHALPSFMAVLVAMIVAEKLGVPSIFDLILRKKNLPYLQVLDFQQRTLTAKDVMEETPVQVMLHRDSTFGDAKHLISSKDSQPIPVVDTETNPLFFGTLMKSVVKEKLEDAYIAAGLALKLIDEPWFTYKPALQNDDSGGTATSTMTAAFRRSDIAKFFSKSTRSSHAPRKSGSTHGPAESKGSTPEGKLTIMDIRNAHGWQSPRSTCDNSECSDATTDSRRSPSPEPGSPSLTIAEGQESASTPPESFLARAKRRSPSLRVLSTRKSSNSKSSRTRSVSVGNVGVSHLLDVQPGSVYRGFIQLEPESAEADAALAELLSRNLGLLKSDAELDGITSYVQPAPFTVQQLVGCIARDDMIRANQRKLSRRSDAVAVTKAPPAKQQPLAAAAMEAALSVVVDPDGPKGEARS